MRNLARKISFPSYLALLIISIQFAGAAPISSSWSGPTVHSDDGQAQQAVGWVANPSRWGTLMLLVECLTTVFACTWTVLHLNIPKVQDTTATRLLRKIKWMIVTILFPEFIFAKAICDLRLALHTLHMMAEKIESSPEAFRSSSECQTDASTGTTVCRSQEWEVDYGARLRWLHKRLVGSQEPVEGDDKMPGEKDRAHEIIAPSGEVLSDNQTLQVPRQRR